MDIKQTRKTACPNCKSKGWDHDNDNLIIYNDYKDGAFCFACGYTVKSNSFNKEEDINLLTLEGINNLNSDSFRGIAKDVIELYGAKIEYDVQTREHLAYYYPVHVNGYLSGYRKRQLPKKFSSIGDTKKAELFGQSLRNPGGKFIVVTEAQDDAMAAYQIIREIVGKPYHVVSSWGTDGWSHGVDYLSSFEKVVICFDNDPPGKKAAQELAETLPPGKALIAECPLHDANECLLANKKQEFWKALQSAKSIKYGGIVAGCDTWDLVINRPNVKSIPFPEEWGDLQAKTRGRRFGQITLWSSGSGCVDADTEYLSPSGWRRIADYAGEEVAQYDGAVTSFCKPDAYIKLPCHELFRIKTKYGIDMTLCEDHNVVYEASSKLYKKRLKDVMDIHRSQVTGFRGRIPTTFAHNGKGLPHSDSHLRLRVMVNADGYIAGKLQNGYETYVNVKKLRKQQRVVKLLNEAGIPYSINKSAEGYLRFRFIQPYTKGYDDSWYGASYNQLKVICNECLLWDGDCKSRFYSTVKQSSDFIQFAFSATGKRCSMQITHREDKGHTEYNLTVSDNTYVSFRKTAASSPEFEKVIPKDGFKYCFTVPTGMLVLRSNNHVFITGNCGKSALLRNLRYYDLLYNDDVVNGVISLEDPLIDEIDNLVGLHMGRRFLDEAKPHEVEGYKKAWEFTHNRNKIFYYDTEGHAEKSADGLINKLRYMVNVLGCNELTIDHITLAVAEMQSEGEDLKEQHLMAKLINFVKESNVHINLISQLRKPLNGSKSWENGDMPTVNDLYGSSAIKQGSADIIFFARDQQAEDRNVRNTIQLAVGKCRKTGDTGPAGEVLYEAMTGRIVASNPQI